MEGLDLAWARGWKGVDRRSIVKWAEDNIDLGDAYAKPGPFRVESSPYLRRVFEDFQRPEVRHINVLKGVQLGGSLAWEICYQWAFDVSPGPSMIVQQTDDEATQHFDSRVVQMSERSLANRDRFARRRKRRDYIRFPHMDLYINGANITSLQRKSIKWLYGDEPWQWAPGMMAEALARCDGYPSSKKILFVSQAGDVESDWFTKWHEGQRHDLTIACTRCGYRQPLEFFGRMLDAPEQRAGIVWNESARRKNGTWEIQACAESAAYRCIKCGHRHEDEPRIWRAFDATMEHTMRPDDAARGNAMVSLQFNSLVRGYWGELVKEFLHACEARDRGVVHWLKRFYQKKILKFWSDELGREKIVLAKLDYARGRVPDDADYVFLTADYQEGRGDESEHYWFVARAWWEDGSSRLIDEGRVATHEELRGIQQSLGILDRCVAIDGGHRLQYIAGMFARYGWILLEGSKQEMFPHRRKVGKRSTSLMRPFSPPRRVDPRRGRRGAGRAFAVSFLWSNPSVKETLWRLRHGQGAPWEVFADVSDDYEDHMDSEIRVRVVNKNTGAESFIWKCIKDNRNHLWDCECEQTVCAYIAGILVFDPDEKNEDTPAEDAPEPPKKPKPRPQPDNQLALSL